MRRTPGIVQWIAASAPLFLACGQPLAQTYPSAPVTVVTAYNPGSGADTAWRAMAASAAGHLGQSIVVDNRPGVAGRGGINALKTARNDGYVVAAVSTGELIVPGLSDPSLALESGRDYVPVILAVENPLVLVAHPSVPFRDVKGLVAHAKANPGKLNVGTSGVGTTTHLAVELLAMAAGINLVHVPYKGSPPALTDLLAGRIQLNFTSATARASVEAGKLAGIATTGAKRWRLFPSLPTMVESGFQSIIVAPWQGLLAPGGISKDAMTKLNQAFGAALKDAGTRGKLEAIGVEPIGSTPEEFARQIRFDTETLGPVVRKLGLRVG